MKKIYYYVEQVGPAEFDMWLVNENDVPSGEPTRVSMEEIISGYHPEVEYYNRKIKPALKQLKGHLAWGDRHRARGEHFSAEMEYKGALRLDEANVRATFGLGLTYLEHGEVEKGRELFRSLIGLDAAFEPQHKHLFNEFGILLRKNAMYDEAVAYFEKALRFCADDDHLYYNLARSRYHAGDWSGSVQALLLCLEISPGQQDAVGLLTAISNHFDAEGNPKKSVASKVPKLPAEFGDALPLVRHLLGGKGASVQAEVRRARESLGIAPPSESGMGADVVKGRT